MRLKQKLNEEENNKPELLKMKKRKSRKESSKPEEVKNLLIKNHPNLKENHHKWSLNFSIDLFVQLFLKIIANSLNKPLKSLFLVAINLILILSPNPIIHDL